MIDNRDLVDILKKSLSPYEYYCDGYGNSNSSGNSYILGLTLSIGKTTRVFNKFGSLTLDNINAFDIAETSEAYIGQINMSIVSSFCGPQGLVWGHDICKSESLYSEENFFKKVEYQSKYADVYYARPLINATKKLFGTVDNKLFPLRPGAHVPCASKNITLSGKNDIYAAVAIGIPEDREKNACLLMEDYGYIKSSSTDSEIYENEIRENLAKSVIQIGFNQNITYKNIFVEVKSTKLKSDEVGCILIAAPYFTIAQKAIKSKGINEKNIFNLNINEWYSKMNDSKNS